MIFSRPSNASGNDRVTRRHPGRAVFTNSSTPLDAWHLYPSGGTVEDLDRISAQDVVVHVNDAPPGIPQDEQINNVRALPMETGVIDLSAFMQKLDQMRYDGPVTPAPFSTRLNDMASTDPLRAVRTAAESMDALWKAASLDSPTS